MCIILLPRNWTWNTECGLIGRDLRMKVWPVKKLIHILCNKVPRSISLDRSWKSEFNCQKLQFEGVANYHIYLHISDGLTLERWGSCCGTLFPKMNEGRTRGKTQWKRRMLLHGGNVWRAFRFVSGAHEASLSPLTTSLSSSLTPTSVICRLCIKNIHNKYRVGCHQIIL